MKTKHLLKPSVLLLIFIFSGVQPALIYSQGSSKTKDPEVVGTPKKYEEKAKPSIVKEKEMACMEKWMEATCIKKDESAEKAMVSPNRTHSPEKIQTLQQSTLRMQKISYEEWLKDYRRKKYSINLEGLIVGMRQPRFVSQTQID